MSAMKLQPVVVLLCLTTVTMDRNAGATESPEQDGMQVVKDFTNKLLQVVPSNSNASYVSELVLDGNRILLNSSDRQALGTYPALVELHLERNVVTRVPAGFFSVVPNLTKLSLAGNNIHSLDSEAFSGLARLTNLDLSENKLESLPAELHKGLHSLQVLQLQGNPWNCSCLLLIPITELTAANISIGGGAVTCASPPSQAGSEVLKAAAQCSPPDNGTESLTPTASGSSQQPLTPTTKLNESESQNHNNTTGQKAALGNSWKFTVSVAALALITSALIVCAVKGPSWYKLFHNYRHRRLHQDDDCNEDNYVSTVFKKKGSYQTPQAFSFENQDARPEESGEEPEDEYFEDPYIKSNTTEGEEVPTEL